MVVTRFLFLTLILAIHACANNEENQPVFKWDPIEINGEAYVQLSEIQKFYQFNRFNIDGNKITLEHDKVTIKLTPGEQAMLMNGVKYFLSEPIRMQGKAPHLSKLDLTTLIDPILRPNFQKMPPLKTVILDPGHGGKDKGSAKLESEYTLSLALRIQKILKTKGYKVMLTREQDAFVSLKNRVKMANATADAIFVSLHFNAGNKDVHGFESYIPSARQPGQTHAANAILATALHSRCLLHLNHKRLGKPFNIADRGIKRARFSVLSTCKHPSVIIEAGFLTNKAEAEKIKTDAYQRRLANAIVSGIDVYKKSPAKRNK